MTAAATTVLLSLLGAASLAGDPALRAAADLAGTAVVVTYLRSPALLARRAAREGLTVTMRIIIVTHYFPPETGAPQARLSALAAAWAADGDDVTVLTGMPNHPTGVMPPEYRGAIRRRERRDGYRVLRTWLYATPNEGVARKTVGHLSFMITSVLLGGRASGPADVVVVSSPTFFSIGAGWLLARLKRARLVVEVRDLWPAIFTELGVLTSRRVIRAAGTAGARRLRGGRHRDRGQRRVPRQPDRARRARPTRCIPSATASAPASSIQAPRRTRGCAPGSAPAPMTAWCSTPGRTASRRGSPRWPTPPPGSPASRSGSRSSARARTSSGCGDRVAELGLRNVTLLPGVPHEQVPALLAAADICLVPLRDVPLFSSFIPSKMFEYLAAGRPVVGAVAGEAAQILREAGAWVVPPADSAALADAIRALAADPQRRQAMGRQGRCYVEKYFDRETLARQYRKLLDAPGGRR